MMPDPARRAPTPPPGEVVHISYMGKPRLVALPEVLAMLERAHGEVSRICRERWDGKHGWKTTIPAEETDSDLLIGQALSAAAAFLERGLTVARDAPDVGMMPASSYDDAVRAVGQLELNVRYWRERAERAEAAHDVPKLTEPESVEAHAIYVRLCDQGDPYALVRTIERFRRNRKPEDIESHFASSGPKPAQAGPVVVGSNADGAPAPVPCVPTCPVREAAAALSRTLSDHRKGGSATKSPKGGFSITCESCLDYLRALEQALTAPCVPPAAPSEAGIEETPKRDTGAGRVMSRTEAKGKVKKGRVVKEGRVTPLMMETWLTARDVVLRGGGLDESPHAYRRLPDVLAAQGATVRVLHTLKPIIVVMAGADEFDPYKD